MHSFARSVCSLVLGCVATLFATTLASARQAVLPAEPTALVVHIVDADGALLGEGWTVHATDTSSVPGSARRGVHVAARHDPATGVFRVIGLAPGDVRVSAVGPNAAQIDEVWFRCAAGVTTEVELVYGEADPTRRIVVTVDAHLLPFRGYGPSPVTLHLPSGERCPLVRARSRVDTWIAEGLPEGEYSLTIDEPPFVPWRADHVRPGQSIVADLRGDATVVLDVVGPDGAPLAGAYQVSARHLDASDDRWQAALRASPPGTFSGLPAGTLDLEVHAFNSVPRVPSRRVRVADLARGETRTVRVQLTTLGTLRGIVVDADGAPAPGLRVEVTGGEVHGHDRDDVGNWSERRLVGGVERLVPIPRIQAALTTDAHGEFALEELAPDLYAVRILVPPVTTVDVVIEVGPGTRAPVESRLPRVGGVRIRVLFPAHSDPTGRAVTLSKWTGSGAQAAFQFGGSGVSSVALDREGRCVIPDVEPGEYSVTLRLGDPEPGGIPLAPTLDLGVIGVGRFLYGVEAEPSSEGPLPEHVLDARGRFPGVVRATLLLQGEPSGRLHVTFQPMDPGADGAALQSFSGPRRGGGPQDYFVAPGRNRVQIHDAAERWTWEVPSPLRVEAGALLEVTFDVVLVQREVRLEVAGSGPLADVDVELLTAPFAHRIQTRRTDATGMTTFEVPPGTYQVGRVGQSDSRASFAFDAGDGPLVVQLPK